MSKDDVKKDIAKAERDVWETALGNDRRETEREKGLAALAMYGGGIGGLIAGGLLGRGAKRLLGRPIGRQRFEAVTALTGAGVGGYHGVKAVKDATQPAREKRRENLYNSRRK